MPRPPPDGFPGRLIQARGEWPQGRLDRLARLPAGSVAHYEEDGRLPNLRSLRALAEALGCTVGWLADGSGPAPHPRTMLEEKRP